MKRVNRPQEPLELTNFRQTAPASTWEQMKNDVNHKGSEVYDICRAQLVSTQGGICAYCEIDIRDNNPLTCRVEHFHPKSDMTPAHNWALDWNNMLGVCAGGSYRYAQTPYTQEPLADNLSCDAHKDQMIQSGKLPEQCEGWILDPSKLFASPSLFRLEKSTGRFMPDTDQCQAANTWPGNKHVNMEKLVQHTLDMLNLNCDRLRQARLTLIRDIERNKKRQREQGFSSVQGLDNLATRYLRQHWPAFFTTIRLCLGAAVETHLTHIRFQG